MMASQIHENTPWPKFCFFCTQRLNNTKHCQLPFDFITRYDIPTDDTQKRDELIEIHATYSVSKLFENSLLHNWKNWNPHVIAQSTYSESIPATSVDHADSLLASTSDISNQLMSQPSSSHSFPLDTGVPITIANPSQTSESIQNEPSEPDISLPLPAQIQSYQPTSIGSGSTIQPNQNSPQHEDISKDIETKENKPKQQADIPSNSPEPEDLSKQTIIHISNDLFRTIVVAHFIETRGHRSNKSSQFVEALLTELNYVTELGSKYVKNTSTRLDHHIPLAKEIVATHSKTLLNEWVNGRKEGTCYHCILNFNDFEANIDDNDETRLFDSLIAYTKSIFNSEQIKPFDKVQIRKHLAEQIKSREFQRCLTWYDKATKESFTSIQIPLKLQQRMRASQHQPPQVGKQKLKPYAQALKDDVIDKALLDRIDIAEISANAYSNHAHEFNNDEEKFQIATKILGSLKLIIERYPSWKKPNFKVSHTTVDAVINDSPGELENNNHHLMKLILDESLSIIRTKVRNLQMDDSIYKERGTSSVELPELK